MLPHLPTIDDVRDAADRIRPFIHRTPIITSHSLDELIGAHLFFKCENVQKVGAFKARGACNAVLMLDEVVAKRGVVTHSSGNHAQALAYAARLRGIQCTIVMPSNAPMVKRDAVLEYGASIVLCEPTLQSRLHTMQQIVDATGAHPIPPYDDARVIAGQGTAALEFLEDIPDVDVMMAPVGGGGLLSGTAIVTRALCPNAEIIGAEPEVADDAKRSLETGIRQPPTTNLTIADGLRTALGEIPFAVLQQTQVRIVTAKEKSIIDGLYHMMERLKIVIEPSASVTLGALIDDPELVRGKRVGIIVCGGNLDVRTHLKF
ncbi:MAG: pyridoxal-phosphate dependent enzyme [Candidatus Kapabacteria bacterium]|nr:pyridoxal-phosphate dependent enzyme [Candidatus Kapabacteria bacterium]